MAGPNPKQHGGTPGKHDNIHVFQRNTENPIRTASPSVTNRSKATARLSNVSDHIQYHCHHVIVCVYAVMEGSITPTTNLVGLTFLIPPSARLLTRVSGRTLAGFKVNVYISSQRSAKTRVVQSISREEGDLTVLFTCTY